MHRKASAAANNYFHYDSYSFNESIAHLVCEIYFKKRIRETIFNENDQEKQKMITFDKLE